MSRRNPEPLTQEQRVLRSKLGGLTLAAKTDMNEVAARARRGFDARFERLVDPDNELAPAERARRAEAARKAHMVRMSLLASQARARKRAAS